MNVGKMAGMAVAALLLAGGAAFGQAHAPWPTDWNNWNDPALWVTVGNPGNAGELSGEGAGEHGLDRICGAVDYTFRMGKFEVTAGQYTAFLNAVAKTDTYGLYATGMWSGFAGCMIQRSGSPGSFTYTVTADRANRPVNWVSWGDAGRFANWLTNGQPDGNQDLTTTEDGSYLLNGATTDDQLLAVTRKTVQQGGRYYIPTEDEWYKAAYHKNDGNTANYWDYPTHTNARPSNDLTNPDPGNNANFFIQVGGGDYTVGSPFWTTEVGEFENSNSPYGTFDQGGNVWEWGEAILVDSFPLKRQLRGGSFAADSDYLLSADRHMGHYPTYETGYFGFRVSEVPEPASMAFLALGGLALIRRRGAWPVRRGVVPMVPILSFAG